jgi:hypothetical protein
MPNLEELTLYINNKDRMEFVDGTQINNEILVHMPRLNKFTFHITTNTRRQHIVNYLSNNDIQETFTNIGYQEVGCIVNYAARNGICQIFSLPFTADYLSFVGNKFPSIIFRHVITLSLFETVPFVYDFFLRIARYFPSVKKLNIFNGVPQLHSSDDFNSNGNQSYPIVEYPNLISLGLVGCHIDYIEQFLNNTKTHLPRLTQLEICYFKLRIVTQDFTNDATRLTCAQVKQLIMDYDTSLLSKDFYTYFPFVTVLPVT